jgi:hypothetical protein
MAAQFEQLCNSIIKPQNEQEKEYFNRQEKLNLDKQNVIEEFKKRFTAPELDNILHISHVNKFVQDKTGLTLDIDELYLAYYQLLLKG